jgi:hypothetical protein
MDFYGRGPSLPLLKSRYGNCERALNLKLYFFLAFTIASSTDSSTFSALS